MLQIGITPRVDKRARCKSRPRRRRVVSTCDFSVTSMIEAVVGAKTAPVGYSCWAPGAALKGALKPTFAAPDVFREVALAAARWGATQAEDKWGDRQLESPILVPDWDSVLLTIARLLAAV